MKRLINKYDNARPTILALPNELLMMVAELSPRISLTCRRCYHLGSRYQPVITAISGPNAPSFDKHNTKKVHHATLKRFNRYLDDIIFNDAKSQLITQVKYKHNGFTFDVESSTISKIRSLPNLSKFVYQTDYLDAGIINNFWNFTKLEQLNIKLYDKPYNLNRDITRLMQIPTLNIVAFDFPCTSYSNSSLYGFVAELEDLSAYIPIREDFKLVVNFCHTTSCRHFGCNYEMSNFTVVFTKCTICRNHFVYATNNNDVYSTLAKAYGWPNNKHFIKQKLKERHEF